MEYASIPNQTPGVVDEFSTYRELYDVKPIDFDNDISVREVVKMLHHHIDRNLPFSMARLGDGEGACLFYDQPDLPLLREFCIWRTLALHFGHQRYTEEDFRFFNTEMKAAIASADLVTFARSAPVYKRLLSEETTDLRGYVGATFANHAVMSQKANAQNRIYKDGYLHVALLPFYADILAGRKVVLIGSAPATFCTALSRHFDFELFANITIPDQSVNIGKAVGEFLYPDFLTTVRDQVKSLAEPGVVFVMAAGLATKFLCRDVQEGGGVALDVGSVMDVWQGKSVRGYQNQALVDKHEIQLQNGTTSR